MKFHGDRPGGIERNDRKGEIMTNTTQMDYEYKTVRFGGPPEGEELSRIAGQGWRLVSVTVDVKPGYTAEPFYVAYFERAAVAATAVAGDRRRSRESAPLEGQEAHAVAELAGR